MLITTMDKGLTCEHLNKLTDILGKDLWQSKEALTCFDCGCSSPNLWICLQPECHHIGCSEVKNDHSTQHQKALPAHCVHMNVTTERIWCYACEKEVHIKAAMTQMRPDSTMDAAYSDQDSEDADYMDDPSRGLIGLQNMGNTCYMNAALQALSNTLPLTSYFLECRAAVAVLTNDRKPAAISRAYQKLIKEMWSRRTRGYVVPNGFLYGIRNVHPMFRGYHQHDTQEFLRCFMDQLHEELKEPVWDSPAEDKLSTEADGDHQKTSAPFRRRAASTGGQTEAIKDNIGSESELSWSSEAEERYETCSSGASDVPSKPERREPPKSNGCGGGDGGAPRYRSIISDVFDGRLLSSVQCLICNRVSTRVETFQDLSLPIPSREHVAALRAQQPAPLAALHAHDSWLNVWWVLSWLRSWFYGPIVSLQDCLAAFFSADELKGDNMYSCSRCNKLRNGIKMSYVVRLPEVLCVHLKRFRHELMFSAKVAARVSFPVADLDMAPYIHKDCTSKITRYELCAVICHAGTAGGGHYTCVAKNGHNWYCYDDAQVTPLSHQQLAHTEAYVLFYKKINPQMAELRRKVAEILESSNPNAVNYLISKQWINKFNTWAEPGPIDNSDFVCAHGGVRPDRALHLRSLAADAPQPLWEFFYAHFGGGPAVTRVHECGVCARAAQRLRTRRARELQAFCDLRASFQGHTQYYHISWKLVGRQELEKDQNHPRAIYAISMHWFRQWQAFVRSKTHQPPPPVDNSGIATKQEVDGQITYTLKQGSDHAPLSEELWRFFTDIYGGGPEVQIQSPTQPHTETKDKPETRRIFRKYSESHKEDYCSKSTSETNIRDCIHSKLKNQSLQNINRHYVVSRTADSDEDINYRHSVQYKRPEPNGNYDSDDGMDPNPPKTDMNTVRMENGLDSSDHDASDNPNNENPSESDLPNVESISLKSKPKSGKVRKTKKRTVK